MCPAKIVAPNEVVIYVPEDDTLDAYNKKELALLPTMDRKILEESCIVGEHDGYIFDSGTRDPVKITTFSVSNVPPAHRRTTIIWEIDEVKPAN